MNSKASAVVLFFYPVNLVNGTDGSALLMDNCDLVASARGRVSYFNKSPYSS
jgi:hypothetical protein